MIMIPKIPTESLYSQWDLQLAPQEHILQDAEAMGPMGLESFLVGGEWLP